jgi:hypothetical protein
MFSKCVCYGPDIVLSTRCGSKYNKDPDLSELTSGTKRETLTNKELSISCGKWHREKSNRKRKEIDTGKSRVKSSSIFCCCNKILDWMMAQNSGG